MHNIVAVVHAVHNERFSMHMGGASNWAERQVIWRSVKWFWVRGFSMAYLDMTRILRFGRQTPKATDAPLAAGGPKTHTERIMMCIDTHR